MDGSIVDSRGEIRGVLHAPDGKATRVAVAWPIGARTISVRGDGVAIDVPVDGLTARSGGWRGGAVHLIWSDDAGASAVTVDEATSLLALEERATPGIAEAARAARAGARRTKGRFRLAVGLIAAVVALPFLALAFLLFHPDPLLDFVVPRLPTAFDREIGAMVRSQTEGAGNVVPDGPAAAAVDAIAARLLAHAPAHPYTFEFVLVRDETVNAFAAPGGFVVVHTGLLAHAASAEEVAGVVAHEMAHVLERHSVRQLVREVGFWALVAATFGSVDGLGGVVVDGARNLAQLDFSRDQERAADDLGYALLRAASLPTDGMVTFFERLAEDEPGVPALLSTHPGSAERAERLRARAREDGAPEVRPLDVDWVAVQASLR
ncbi:MAG: M48 family metallopeptidase [Planctomycetota bacterium JB042]